MEKAKTNTSKLIKTIVLWTIFAAIVITALIFFILDNKIFPGFKLTQQEYANKFCGGDQSKINPTAFNMYTLVVPGILRTIQIMGVCLVAAVGLHYLAKIKMADKKALTILKLTCNFLKWTIVIVGVFTTLAAWGVDTLFLLASAGVVTLIIGLGSQTLIADILAGIFIVFEGDFQVGDIIIIDGWRGEVQSIGIRTTRLIDAGFNVKIVNNSEIKTLINQTKELSLAKCYVAISYADRIEKVEAVIADNIDKIKEKIPLIVEGPYYKGVSDLAESSVNLLFVAMCNENDIYQVQRDMNREIKIMFDNNGINIPFNQIVVHMGENDKPSEISKSELRKAEEFVEEQKELSKAIDVKSSSEE